MKCVSCSELEYCGSISREMKSSSNSKLLSYLNSTEICCIDYCITHICNAELLDRTERLITKSIELRNALKQASNDIKSRKNKILQCNT
jgi:hypothetical protein